MGKTQPTYRDRIRRFESRWEPFLRALRREYHDAYQRLFTHARQFADAAGIQNEPTTFEPVMWSVCLGQQHEIQQLKDRVGTLEERVEELENAVENNT